MRRVTSMLLVASAVLAGAAGLYVSQAPAQFASSPFGSGPSGAAASSGDGGVPCGVNDTCAALGYEATTTADGGVGFACDASLPSCVRLGANACNRLGEDPVTGYATFGAGCNPVLDVGAGNTRIQSGVIAVTNGAIFTRSSYVQNDGAGFAGAVPIEDLDGLEINGGTPIVLRLLRSVAVDVPELDNNASAVLTVTVSGAVVGSSVHVNPDNCTLPASFAIGYAQVTSANTVSLDVGNRSNSVVIDPASCSFLFEVIK